MPIGRFVIDKIREQRAFGADSGTETIDLPTANYLQALNLRVENVNGTTSNTAETIIDCITKLELLGDGIVLYQATGLMARKFAQFDNKELLPYNEQQTASKKQHAVFPISFGRHRMDKDLILPSWAFTTLQLKITYSFTDSTTVGWTTSESNAKYDLMARNLISKQRVKTPFLKKIEHYSKTLSTVQEEEIDLPVGAGAGAYRRICVYAREAEIGDGVDIDKYELLVNDSQRVVNERWDTSQAEDSMRYGANNNKALTLYANDNDTYDCDCTNIRAVVGQAHNDDDCIVTIAHDTATDDLLTIGMIDDAGTAVDGKLVDLNILAPGVSNATMIDLGTDNIQDSLNVGKDTGISTLKLKLNVAAAGAVTKVFTEQVVYF